MGRSEFGVSVSRNRPSGEVRRGEALSLHHDPCCRDSLTIVDDNALERRQEQQTGRQGENGEKSEGAQASPRHDQGTVSLMVEPRRQVFLVQALTLTSISSGPSSGVRLTSAWMSTLSS